MNGLMDGTVVHKMKESKGTSVVVKCGLTFDTKNPGGNRWTSWNEVTCPDCLDQTLARIMERPEDYQALRDAYKKR